MRQFNTAAIEEGYEKRTSKGPARPAKRPAAGKGQNSIGTGVLELVPAKKRLVEYGGRRSERQPGNGSAPTGEQEP